MTWLISLQGDATDLEEFPQRFPSGPVHAVVEGEATYLTGPSFDECADEREVMARAKTALEKMCGIISLLWPAFKKPTLGPVIHRNALGGQSRYMFLEGREVRVKIGTLTPIVNGVRVQPVLTDAEQMLAKSQSCAHLAAAVTLWAWPGRGWGQLYRITEEITQHLKAPPSRFDHCDETDLERFEQSAQSHDAAGLGARHAIGKVPPPKRPMDLNEATQFVEKLLHSVLRS
jgi:hypothetical protein